MDQLFRIPFRAYIWIAALLVGAAALILNWMGHPVICECGRVMLWNFTTGTGENSQHLIDWYTPSHIVHGFLFYAGLWLLFRRRLPLGALLVMAVFLEAAWEIIENTPYLMERYRTATVALDYFGDSVINSVFDILSMVFGFILARRLPILASVACIVFLELFVGYMIRDNLTLNIIMLLWPLDFIREWQASV